MSAATRATLPDWISTVGGSVHVSAALVAVYCVVAPRTAERGAYRPMLHVVVKQPSASHGTGRGGMLVHALLWLHGVDSAQQASADAEAAKQRLLVHAHRMAGQVRLQGCSIDRSGDGLDLWLDGGRVLGCVLQPKPAKAPEAAVVVVA